MVEDKSVPQTFAEFGQQPNYGVDADKVEKLWADTEHLKFQQHLINPKAEKYFEIITRDFTLGNIDKKIMGFLIERLDFAVELEGLGFNGAAMAFYSELEGYIVMSRSVDGFQQKMLATSILQHSKTETSVQSVNQQTGGRRFWFFGKK